MMSKRVPKLRFPEFRNEEEWEEKKIEELCKKIAQGGTPNTSVLDYWNGSINWLTPAEMGKTIKPYITETLRTLTELGLRNCSSPLLPINSVIISTRAPIGYITISTFAVRV